jgi:ABC-type multidrug transport system fused ATPase/permease subunit
VLVLEHGKIVEDGTPVDLIARSGGRYASLHRAWLDSLV